MSENKPTGLMSRISSLLFEETPAQKEVVKTVETVAAPVTAGLNLAQGPNPFLEKLTESVMGAQSMYTVLQEKAAPLAQFIPDEGQRTKAAFATMGGTVTAESIVGSIQSVHGKQVIAETGLFEQEVLGPISKELAQNQADLSALVQDLEQLAAREKRVTETFENEMKEIRLLREEAAATDRTLQSNISSLTIKLDSAKAAWASAVATVTTNLSVLEAKVRAYLS